MMRAILRLLARCVFSIFSHIESEGLENIPKQGGAILAPNHLGRMDAPLVFIMLERDDVSGLVANKYRKNFFFRLIVEIVDGIWINRQQADFHAMREAREFLKNGGLLGIAPEGTRSRTGSLMRAKTGVAYLAEKAAVPIVPVAITGTEKIFHELLRFRRPHLKIRVGQQFRLHPLQQSDRSGSLRSNTDEIMCQIAVLLPPEYRGVYADHPRLLELLTHSEPRV